MGIFKLKILGVMFMNSMVESFPTLQAGYTYTFLINDVFWSGQDLTNLSSNDQIKFTADGSTEYITGITVVGAAGDSGADAYVQFVVPSDDATFILVH